MTIKQRRHQRIRDLLRRNEVHSQQQLQELLAAEHIAVTQATLSRDLRDIGVAKGPRGYELAEQRVKAEHIDHALRRGLAGRIVSIRQGGTLVVVRTRGGEARDLAARIEGADLALVLGTVAGDDTVFVATQSSNQAAHLVRLLRSLTGRR
ncbi:MAG: arginine repressor [Planctomycetota bacterium]|jgi:transcriptional regulator of arginine metabolism